MENYIKQVIHPEDLETAEKELLYAFSDDFYNNDWAFDYQSEQRTFYIEEALDDNDYDYSRGYKDLEDIEEILKENGVESYEEKAQTIFSKAEEEAGNDLGDEFDRYYNTPKWEDTDSKIEDDNIDIVEITHYFSFFLGENKINMEALFQYVFKPEERRLLSTVDEEDLKGNHIIFDSIEFNNKYLKEESGVDIKLVRFINTFYKDVKVDVDANRAKADVEQAWKEFAKILKEKYKTNGVWVSGTASWSDFEVDGLPFEEAIRYPKGAPDHSGYSDADTGTFKMARKLSDKNVGKLSNK